ncbi:MAG: undecaprenyldiphospho-muramoylpentapeptide beta-N-acetylglucosaminyltransferase [Candidatus Omnitrophica bacterium]|nr:undecaprenyldiphospho-muramoylpentapeptide beta-N-acetylglucosaminyltransferase [Candidatus Omnitrophota bacterium]MDD5488019.1 undecaprenyldiphospho-muramoylpentapeptide beta-N-acetylglucosaminyltransferase [Candidatus Omnitrophota bacterium]
MKVILAAGGSGGHIYPAIALAEALESEGVRGTDIMIVASKKRLDVNILSGYKYRKEHLSANPMPRGHNIIKWVVFAWKLSCDSVCSLISILMFRPDVVVGFGGYSSGTISIASYIMGTPVVIHEQNVVPGRANKMLSRIARLIAVSFKGSEQYFPGSEEKVVYTGNPLRKDSLYGDRNGACERLGLRMDRFTVLIMGGSQGATSLNRISSRAALMIKGMPQGDGIQFLHLAGRSDIEETSKFYRENDIPGKVMPFLERISDAYSLCDLAVSRAGAAAVFELACFGRPMVLVPYPNPRNSQGHNARYFSEAGAAICMEEKDISADDLAGCIYELFSNNMKRELLARAATRLANPFSARSLAREVMSLPGKKGNDR